MNTSNILTDREREVHDKVVEGKTNREIARDLCIAPSTAKNYVNRILRKLDATSRVELIVRYYTSIIEALTVPAMHHEEQPARPGSSDTDCGSLTLS
jgi:DNA-binding CsgD family transcriptional regulator